jgi:stearoyl-CoA desaturase (Delta-9 desaturase)
MSDQLREKQPAEVNRAPIRKPQTISGDYIKDRQQHHFLLFNVAPFLGTLLALALLWWFPIGAVEIGLLVGMWALTMVGMSVGLHRYFAHRAFKTSEPVRTGLAILGCMAAQGPVLSWVAVHRRHHEYSDATGDPHSPNPALLAEGSRSTLRGLWHAHIGWLLNHEYPNPSYYAPDLVRDKTLAKINRSYRMWVGLGLLIPTVLGGVLTASWLGALLGFLWGGPVRMFLVDNCILSINSFSHVYGTRAFETGDNSRNNPWVALPTFGESWQNNHHAFAFSAKIGLKWWQIDFGYWVVWSLKTAGMIWDVKEPTTEMLQGKLIARS